MILNHSPLSRNIFLNKSNLMVWSVLAFYNNYPLLFLNEYSKSLVNVYGVVSILNALINWQNLDNFRLGSVENNLQKL